MTGRAVAEKNQSQKNDTFPFPFPFDITLEILRYLKIKDLLMLSLVSKKTKELAENNRLWFPFYAARAQQSLLKIDDTVCYKDQYKKQSEMEVKQIGEEIERIKGVYCTQNVDRLALVNLLTQLKANPSVGSDVLKGALLFVSKQIVSSSAAFCLYGKCHQLASLIGTALNKMNLDRSDNDYLEVLHQFIKTQPDMFFADLRWKRLELITAINKIMLMEIEKANAASKKSSYIPLLGNVSI
ncbi:F-box protein [Aquicella lusitana]|uniref:F-box associated protein n=1 Tax=Aquicella lusitana TaxID=254246 RepID=A0A370GF36_9COXI|nr:F-box protein [Aquicella lusitana]RDI42422.1 F-box associated protein [Aquicella lusitana]VVC74116.1 hypothetical protein AQULUS_18810 [Aquicella lusitana]